MATNTACQYFLLQIFSGEKISKTLKPKAIFVSLSLGKVQGVPLICKQKEIYLKKLILQQMVTFVLSLSFFAPRVSKLRIAREYSMREKPTRR